MQKQCIQLDNTCVIATFQKGLLESNLAGIEIDEIGHIQLLVASRPRGQSVIVDPAGQTLTSSSHSNIKVCFPKGSFVDRTHVRLQVCILCISDHIRSELSS